jgi:hypothetical protein
MPDDHILPELFSAALVDFFLEHFSQGFPMLDSCAIRLEAPFQGASVVSPGKINCDAD